MLRRIVLERMLLQKRAESVSLHALIGMHWAVRQQEQAKQRRRDQDPEKKPVPLTDYFFLNSALGVASAFKSPKAY